MADRRELELHLATPGYMSRIVVDGVELSNIQRATVQSSVDGLTTVEIGYVALQKPFILRGEMVVVYDGPAELPVAPVTYTGPICCKCGAPANWGLVYGPSPDDTTHACHAHLIRAIGDGAQVWPL